MSLKFAFRELTLAAGARKRVHEVASFFMLVSNTGSLKVKVAIGKSSLSDCPIGYDFMERKEDTFFPFIDFKNPNAGSITIEYILSTGIVKSSPTIESLAEILEELRGLSTGEIWGTELTVTALAQVVMVANPSRHSGWVQAKSTNSGIMYIGYDNTVDFTKWIAELLPSQSFSFDDWLGAIWVISTEANQKLGYGEH